MEGKKQNRITSHVIIITSDAEDAGVKQFRIRSWVAGLVIIILCGIGGALIGYFAYEAKIWEEAVEKSNAQLRVMEELQTENEQVKSDMELKEIELLEEIQTLKEEVQVLSTTLNQKVESESQLIEEMEKLSNPTSFPLNGSASSLEVEGADAPVAKIVTSPGVMVVAAAKGNVIAVNDDVEYGHSIWIDHGNGYITIYRNQADPSVKQGDTVFQGTTLYLIGDKNRELGYQIMYHDQYINPMEMIDIRG